MADSVSTQVILDDARNYVAKFTNVSDGTGETNVVKITGSAVNIGNPNGHWKLWGLNYDIRTMAVRIIWGGGTPADLLVLGGFANTHDFSKWGGITNNAGTPNGNILFTTIGAASNSTYSIILWLKKGI